MKGGGCGGTWDWLYASTHWTLISLANTKPYHNAKVCARGKNATIPSGNDD